MDVDVDRAHPPSYLGSFEWVPSQKGGEAVRLHPQNATRLGSVIVVSNGVKPVPLCAPSQKGWLWDRPHRHQW
jgi:hypothetical protein